MNDHAALTRLENGMLCGFQYHDGYIRRLDFVSGEQMHVSIECEGRRFRLEFSEASVLVKLYGLWQVGSVFAWPTNDACAMHGLSELYADDPSSVSRAIDVGGWVFQVDDCRGGAIHVFSECKELHRALRVVREAGPSGAPLCSG